MPEQEFEKECGNDDLEQIACKGDLAALNEYLKTRAVLIPRRPNRFLEASNFTQAQLMEQIRLDAQEAKTTPFEPWILELGGMKRLPAFSDQQKLRNFAAKISQQLNKVFSLGAAQGLLSEITKNLDVEMVDLNLFSEKSWEIEIRKSR